MSNTSDFFPPGPLQNPHVQSILASAGPRKLKLMARSRELSRVSKSVILDCGHGTQLLGGVTFKVSAGTKTALIGPNGTGKTTLLNILSQLINPHERLVTIEDVAELHRSSGFPSPECF